MKLIALTTAILLAAPLFAQAPDDRADAIPMFAPSGWLGSTGHFLEPISPPVLGGVLGMQLHTDPSAGFAWFFAGARANSGTPLVVIDTMQLYLDPVSILGSVPSPVVGGNAQLILPLPPTPSLVGADLAWQAIVASPTNLGATNMLATNLGLHFGPGNLQFGWQFTATLQPQRYYEGANGIPSPIYCNRSNVTCQVTISGVRNTSGGRLEIRNSQNQGPRGGSSILATVPAAQAQFSVTVTVQPGQCLYFYNRDDAPAGGGVQSGPITVRYQISANCR